MEAMLMSTPPPCASCLAADLPSVVSKSKKRKLRERNLAIRKAVENIQSLLDAAPFICKQSSEGDVSTPVQPTVNLEECLRALVLKVDAILDAVMPLVNSRHVANGWPMSTPIRCWKMDRKKNKYGIRSRTLPMALVFVWLRRRAFSHIAFASMI